MPTKGTTYTKAESTIVIQKSGCDHDSYGGRLALPSSDSTTIMSGGDQGMPSLVHSRLQEQLKAPSMCVQ